MQMTFPLRSTLFERKPVHTWVAFSSRLHEGYHLKVSKPEMASQVQILLAPLYLCFRFWHSSCFLWAWNSHGVLWMLCGFLPLSPPLLEKARAVVNRVLWFLLVRLQSTPPSYLFLEQRLELRIYPTGGSK